MSDRDPNADWEQPRGDFSRGGAPHYSGSPNTDQQTPLAASSWTRNRRVILPIAAAIILFVIGLAVFSLTS